MVVEKNLSSFFRHRKKLGMFVLCKVELTWKRSKTTRKDKEEEKMEEWLQERPCGAYFGTKRSSMVLFFVVKVCRLIFLQKQTYQASFGVKRRLVGKE
jgi:hypothetical protein